MPVAEVAAKLSDAGFVANCVPDAQVAEATPDRASGSSSRNCRSSPVADPRRGGDRTRPGKSVTFRDRSPRRWARAAPWRRSSTFKEAEGGGTAVHWTGDLVAMTGCLKMVPKGLLEGAAKKVIEDVWSAVAAKL